MDLDKLVSELDSQLSDVDALRDKLYPGSTGVRQSVHTVYVPADQVVPDLVRSWGSRALSALDTFAPNAGAFTDATGIDAVGVHDLVRSKLSAEPIEDLRIDFEDGYGFPDDATEDAHALAAASLLATASTPFSGVRIKGFEPVGRRRAVRTLSMLLDALNPLPPNFVVTLPKVTSVEQVESMVWLCTQLERFPGELRFELQIETTQAVLGPDGAATVARMIHASDGRCTGLHYGTYDYSAACGVTASLQSMEHPVADHAKNVMLLAAAGTGVHVSDGSTNVLPVGDADAVHVGWRLHTRLVTRSLEHAIYQGWDLHPHQLPTRFLATFSFYRNAFPQAAARLRAYLSKTSGGAFLDEPATAQAMSAALVRGMDCGALIVSEVEAAVGVDRSVLDGFARRRVG